ncbi:MAG: disulfide bond formation protein B [Alphaproteobacteria bacterium]
MMIRIRTDVAAALVTGGAAALLLAGALLFQYAGGYPPCEICHWQRWPHIAAAVFGLGGAALLSRRILPVSAGRIIAGVAILLLALSGALGVYHAGIEWDWWQGPAACTNAGFTPGAAMDFAPIPVAACDEAPWRLFGLSLAGYNTIFSFAAAALGLNLLMRKKKSA